MSQTEVATTPDSARRPMTGRHIPSWWPWAALSAGVFVMLLARNAFLFSTRLYEQGDSGANSILIQQATRFRLLVGNYSREHFHHPGPAYMYLQAAGEWLFRDLLHVVPTAWNGQLIAVFALNSALCGIAVSIVYRWTRSGPCGVIAFVVTMAFAASHTEVINSGWMPDLYVMPFFVFALSAASVAAREPRDLWILAFSGWLLIHGQACFLLFVPVITVAAIAAALWPSRRTLRASITAFVVKRRRCWVPAVVISALFLLPIALELALHWPGYFGQYFSYGASSQSGGHPAGQILRYMLWFWWPRGYALLLVPFAIAVTAAAPRGPVRRFLIAILGVTALTSVAFAYYAVAGIDYLSEYYIGYFYWSAPFLMLLVIAVGLTQAVLTQAVLTKLVPRRTVPRRVATAAAAATAVITLVAAGLIPGMRISLRDNDPALPGAVAALAARGPGKPIVITLAQPAAWIGTTGFLVQAERTGIPACVDQPAWAFMLTTQFICTTSEDKAGTHYDFYSPGPSAGGPVILRFGTTVVTRAH